MDIESEISACLKAYFVQNGTPADKAILSAATAVAMKKLHEFVSLLTEWNAKMNLVSKNSLAEVWTRHVLDSAQLVAYLPADMRRLTDIGSGAGFPALVLAILLQALNLPTDVVLIESIGKKATYLRTSAQQLGLENVRVINDRVENTVFKNVAADVITARAVAALDVLCGYAVKIGGRQTRALFLKGQSYPAELTEAQKHWQFANHIYPNKYSADGVIIQLWNIRNKK